jgi:hypothetical protein
MKREAFNADWLSYFKLAVFQATQARLRGDMQRATQLDNIVERYYADGLDHGFTDDDLFEIESDTRNRTTVESST